ncbi:DNA primase [Sphingomonas zeicaulis]|uniref:hypothetical protein n=1 Tax=Sphingomonas zeicaulis TaxID=1632740 RepID=UPI003D23432A
MKNIQIIAGAANATFSVFQATDEEFAAVFPDGRDIELIEDLIGRLGEDVAGAMLAPIWGRPILKRAALGIHRTLFYDNEQGRGPHPAVKTEGRLEQRIGQSSPTRPVRQASLISPRRLD